MTKVRMHSRNGKLISNYTRNVDVNHDGIADLKLIAKPDRQVTTHAVRVQKVQKLSGFNRLSEKAQARAMSQYRLGTLAGRA